MLKESQIITLIEQGKDPFSIQVFEDSRIVWVPFDLPTDPDEIELFNNDIARQVSAKTGKELLLCSNWEAVLEGGYQASYCDADLEN